MVYLSDMKKFISCIVIGDGMVGKICLFEVFFGQIMFQEYVFIVFNNYVGKFMVGGDKYVVSIFDLVGEVSINCIVYFLNQFNIFIFNNKKFLKNV